MMFTPPTLNYTYEAVPDHPVKVAIPEKRKRNIGKNTDEEGPGIVELVPVLDQEERKRKGNVPDHDPVPPPFLKGIKAFIRGTRIRSSNSGVLEYIFCFLESKFLGSRI